MRKHKLIIIIPFLILFFIFSCTTEKRLYMPGYYVEWLKVENNHYNRKVPGVVSEKNNEPFSVGQQEDPSQMDADSEIIPAANLIASTESSFSVLSYPPVNAIKHNQSTKKTTPIINNQDINIKSNEICDTIVLISGEKIIGKIIEVKRNDYIKYKLCGNLDHETRRVDMDKVSMIKYAQQFEPEDIGKKAYKYGLLAAIIFWAGFIIGPIAILYGILSLLKINKNPLRYKGKVKAIIGIILGSIGFVCSIVIYFFVFLSFGFI